VRAEDERRAHRLVRVAGSAAVALFAVMTVAGPSAPVVANPPGFATPVAGIELAATPEEVFAILGAPDAAARADAVRRHRLVLLLDLGFLVAYPTLLAGVARLLRARGRLGNGVTTLVTALAVVMAIGDALENRELWVLTGLGDPAAMAAPLARLRAFTLLKWYAIFLASAILAVGVARERAWWRWSAPFFAAGALVGFATVLHRAAVEWSMAPTALAWTIAWVYSLRAPSAA
jgi:hypothetical protein